jgi:hypothetical protein
LKIDDYLAQTFPNLPLQPPLFYNWNIGIRFELGDPVEGDENKYKKRVYARSMELFNSINDKCDDVLIVSYDDRYRKQPYKNKFKTKFFTPYLKNKNLKYKLQINEIPFFYPEDDEDNEWCTLRYTLECKVSDINPYSLIRAYFNTNMARIYFINLRKNTIFHIYDSRGCDLISSSKESIRGIYETYNTWILDYDREQIDKTFLYE